MNTKNKGKRGELLLCKELKAHGYDAHRSQQFCGKAGDADIFGLPGIHIECKRVQNLNLYSAMAQAKSDIKEPLPFQVVNLPAVFHRKNNCE